MRKYVNNEIRIKLTRIFIPNRVEIVRHQSEQSNQPLIPN
jgi:hypothetical protein